MATTLKGQNLRIYTVANKTKVIAMATNCTITLTGNTEDATHKDIPDIASAPEITSKSWQVQVDSLSVADTAAMLTAIKSSTKFKLMWSESSPTNNQTLASNDFAREGDAYLSDCTFTFNDRENSTKNLTFTGTGAIITAPDHQDDLEVVDNFAYTKGQYVRMFLCQDHNAGTPNLVVGAAKNLSVHVSVSIENVTTKDTVSDDDWVSNEPVTLSYDISSSAFVKTDESITSSVNAHDLDSLETMYEESKPVQFQIANVSGANNRTKGSVIMSGKVIITSLVINGPNRETATYQTTFTGYGSYTVGS